ncbi:uncharacterized protein LOC121857051 [Homarus americanus]|uniref:uncharacterized protein LOC121857051 n=1 Tax=Homarus americanus TaxID=6706 RepID=UPI001C46F812|nr:uncharacterized protein LOC121857051 [Homarus americanus]XP_042208850.1 uncharacterized protein LOC121857051 [Homarus americanus]XP_042208851.1 uncharacterized protein LOC121857051 [Homarus americanus]
MHQTAVPTAVWQRRTNKIIAAGITIIGLTMMLSLIPQCIYIGIVFVTFALIWLGWMTMKEKKIEPPRPEGEHPASPVLFLVASHHLRQSSRGPTLPDPEDKPPTYDQILKLDGLPPDYYSVLSEKPPRYEDVSPAMGWGACALPTEFYTTELPCVHTTTVGSSVPLEVALHPESASSFLNESPSSWSAQSVLSTTYTAAQNPSFASDNPSFQPTVEDGNVKDFLTYLEITKDNGSFQEERREFGREDANKVDTEFSNI